MRRLSTRERRLVVALCAIAALCVVSFKMAPSQGPDPEEVIVFYANAFGAAKEMTIRLAAAQLPKEDPAAPLVGKPLKLTREKAPKLFGRLENSARYGGVTPGSSQAPKYFIDLVQDDGVQVKDIGVGFTLDCPKQPSRGKLALIPRDMAEMGRGPYPAMVLAIDDYVDELCNPKGAKERRRERQRKLAASMQQRMPGAMGRAGRATGRDMGGMPGLPGGPGQRSPSAGATGRGPLSAAPGGRPGAVRRP